ncbi:MAG TPA: TonB-dependent receptor [Rhizomicrobium sp.]|nr:TonB-dependent receptor [Rhizomicrobium sp.]
MTGSRIPQVGLYSSSPVTAVNQQEIKNEGTVGVETLLNNLPSVFADFTQTASNGATGQATVDLRGLGSTRTLVLVNGSRLMPSDPANPVADLNQVPAALVDHVEVQTGGASAVYGSDAEAGVVNFIMRKDFEGVEVDGQYSVNNAANGNKFYESLQDQFGFAHAPHDWWGGATTDLSLIIGANTPDGKGNITAYVSYRDIQKVLEAVRDFSACSISVKKVADVHVCAGSANKNAWISLDDYYAGSPYFFYQEGNGTPGSGNFVPFTGAGDQRFNFGPLNYLQRPDERYTGGFFAHYEINPMFEVYSDFMFSDDHTLAQIAPSGAFLGNYFTFNCDNPLMTDQERTALCSSDSTGGGCTPVGNTGNCNVVPGFALVAVGRRDIEGGNRIDDLRHTSYRMKVGVKGDLGSGWSYDLYGQYGTTLYSENYSNEWSKQRVANALNVDPMTGQCFSAEDGTDPNCVPLDIFNGFNPTDPNFAAALNYVKAQGFKSGWTREQVVSGALTGDLGQYGVKSPWAKDGAAIAFGGEYRRESLMLNTSRDFQTGDLYGQGAKTLPIPGSGFDVEEGFAEVRVPIIQDMPFAEDFTINGGYRYSSYNLQGVVSSYKYGAEWQPIDDFRLRGSYQHAVRAPNIIELFANANVALYGGNDPCASVHAIVGDPDFDQKLHDNCLSGGGFANAAVPNPGAGILACPASQCNAQFSGNPFLRPEQSNTVSFGVVLTPTFLEGFTATIDYFNIKVKDYLAAVNPNAITGACYSDGATAATQAIACALINRDPGNHSLHTNIGFVDATVRNEGSLETSGVDFEANYNMGLDMLGAEGSGGLSFNFVGTLLDSLKLTPIAGADFLAYDCKGYFGLLCGTPSPEWRHKLRITWTSPWDFDVSLNWRHLSGVSLDINNPHVVLFHGQCGTNGSPCPDLADASIPSFDYFDLAANWSIRPGLQLRVGVDNVFDKSPPVLDSNTAGVSAPPFGNGNTFPGVYDSLGRTVFVGVTAKY